MDEAQTIRTAQDFELDIDTNVARRGGGVYAGVLSGRWGVGAGMNGGYLAAFCLRAVLQESVLPDPLTMTLHYLSRPVIGEAEVRVSAMRVGRGHATYRFDLIQRVGGWPGDGAAGGAGDAGDADEVRITGLVLTGRLRDPGPLDFAPTAPQVPSPFESEDLPRLMGGGEALSMWGRLEQRVATKADVFFLRSEPGEARTGGWTRLADGRPADVLCVPLFVDCWPPAVFSRTMHTDGSGAPTLELTVHWRNRVTPGWIYARLQSDLFAGGYVDEKAELWTEDGVLVAESRQLARYIASGTPFS